MNKIKVGVLTISDRCYRKETVDASGPALVRMIEGGAIENGVVAEVGLVADCREDIERVLLDWSGGRTDVVLTTGGTGVSERDVTPEATEAVVTKKVPGIPHLMFKRCSDITPLSALSRGIAGVRGRSLIINFPGSKKAAKECLEAVAGVIPHAVDLITGRKEEAERAHAALGEKKRSLAGGGGGKRTEDYPCIPVSLAQSIIMKKVLLLRREGLAECGRAQGHVLAQDVVARDPLPPFDASIKDGFAVLSSDGESEKMLTGTSNAGDSVAEARVSPGCCVRVSTGAAVPPGADAVVEVEKTEIIPVGEGKEARVRFAELPCEGENIRFKGSDFDTGEMLLRAGTYLDPPAVGLLAAAGAKSVKVWGKPVVAVISTGNELLGPGEDLKPGKVRDSNRVGLMSLLREEQFEGVDLGIARDEPDHLRDSLERGFRRGDVVVTTGSMSMGERDYLKEILAADFHAEICFGRVLMKPGKPTAFGVLTFEGKRKLWFGLPGNPASAFVTAHLFLLPALRKISGWEKVLPSCVEAVTEKTFDPEERPQYVRGVMSYRVEDGSWYAEVTGSQRSSRIGSCVNANCLLLIPSASEEEPIGSVGREGPDNARPPFKVKALMIGRTFI